MGYGLNTYADSPGGGGGGGGVIMYGSSASFVPCSSYCSTASYFPVSGYNGSGGSGYSPPYKPTKAELAEERRLEKEERKVELEQEKQDRLEELREKKRLANRTLADLSEESKEKIMDHVHSLLREYRMKKEVNKMMSGFKWFAILLGIAVMWHFGTILKIVQQAVTCVK
jgi:hypothetical protein